MSKINPGSEPVSDSFESVAATNLSAFVAAVHERGGHLAGDPVRAPEEDVDGRFGWRLPTAGGEVLVLMPGVDLAVLREVGSASTPCLRVNGEWSWWSGAVMLVAGATDGRP